MASKVMFVAAAVLLALAPLARAEGDPQTGEAVFKKELRGLPYDRGRQEQDRSQPARNCRPALGVVAKLPVFRCHEIGG